MSEGIQRFFMKLTYNGTAYCGWQRQPKQPSVQQTIEEQLSVFLKGPTQVVGCGRTDTGVHAEAYYLHFDTTTQFDIDKLVYQLNSTLPTDIAINSIFKVDEALHARFSATERSYVYRFHFEKSPFKENESWYLRQSLNHEAIQEACKYLLGEQDFTSFAKLHSDVNNHICNITNARWIVIDNSVEFHISANRFLRNMVRAIVGTLVEVGLGKLKPEQVLDIINAKDRGKAGKSVPAHGLYLSQIKYPL